MSSSVGQHLLEALAVLAVHRLEHFVDDRIGQVLDQVGEVVDVQVLDRGDDLVRVHVGEQAFAHFVADVHQHFAVVLGIDQSPDHFALAGRQRFEQVADFRRRSVLTRRRTGRAGRCPVHRTAVAVGARSCRGGRLRPCATSGSGVATRARQGQAFMRPLSPARRAKPTYSLHTAVTRCWLGSRRRSGGDFMRIAILASAILLLGACGREQPHGAPTQAFQQEGVTFKLDPQSAADCTATEPALSRHRAMGCAGRRQDRSGAAFAHDPTGKCSWARIRRAEPRKRATGWSRACGSFCWITARTRSWRRSRRGRVLASKRIVCGSGFSREPCLILWEGL